VVDVDKCNERDLKGMVNKRDDLEVLFSNTKATVLDSSFVKVQLKASLKFWCYKIEVESEGRLYFIYEIANYKDLQRVADYYERQAWDMKSPQAKAKVYKQRHFILSCFAEVKHYFAATSHRVQGTSIPKVIVMYNDILKNMNRIERSKCFYVACSRSINELMIYRGL